MTTLSITAMASSITVIRQDEHASQNAISIESLSLYQQTLKSGDADRRYITHGI